MSRCRNGHLNWDGSNQGVPQTASSWYHNLCRWMRWMMPHHQAPCQPLWFPFSKPLSSPMTAWSWPLTPCPCLPSSSSRPCSSSWEPGIGKHVSGTKPVTMKQETNYHNRHIRWTKIANTHTHTSFDRYSQWNKNIFHWTQLVNITSNNFLTDSRLYPTQHWNAKSQEATVLGGVSTTGCPCQS